MWFEASHTRTHCAHIRERFLTHSLASHTHSRPWVLGVRRVANKKHALPLWQRISITYHLRSFTYTYPLMQSFPYTRRNKCPNSSSIRVSPGSATSSFLYVFSAVLTFRFSHFTHDFLLKKRPLLLLRSCTPKQKQNVKKQMFRFPLFVAVYFIIYY